ncbi:amidohydrolase family protein [Bradyrhizobium brasilense]|uniref:Amidohydrolase family protein n=1 Tax=Bradyrhizobium brasilense TaxID=1419277 RepID=A0ABY8JBY7_9BRAD|nr:amidohydrolase family protein [Bradyrhizobium brasilense]WFU62633.1 amidohydrolase family protein [Bradyrhizobium brasilense]
MKRSARPPRIILPRSTSELAEWHAAAPQVEALEPSLPIIDAHHHLFGTAADAVHYELEDLYQDLGSGHQILATVYVEAYESGWRKTGPASMRPVGEVDMIVDVSRSPLQMPYGQCQVGAGIVAHVDLTLGDAVTDVLDAHLAASKGRLRGVRHCAADDNGTLGSLIKNRPRPQLLLDTSFRRGFASLEARNLVFDAWIYHTQLGELIELADSFPNTIIVLDHIGGPLGAREWGMKRDEVRAGWQRNIRELASRPNITVKIGGMGMIMFGFGFEHSQRPPTAFELAPEWQPYIETCLEAFGTNRCMFESNFPEDKQSCSYVELWNAFKLATRKMSDDERRDLFYRTACQAYRLPEFAELGDSIGL